MAFRMTGINIPQDKRIEIALTYIFGSRADLNIKGGDLDILVVSRKILPIQRRFIKINMYKAIGEQKIDLIVTGEINSPFLKMAVQTGVLL